MKPRLSIPLRSLVVLGLLLPSSAALAQPRWPQFRGPGSRGLAAGTAALPVTFGPGRNQLWKLPLAPGHSSPCIWGDRIFLTGHGDMGLETVCVDQHLHAFGLPRKK